MIVIEDKYKDSDKIVYRYVKTYLKQHNINYKDRQIRMSFNFDESIIFISVFTAIEEFGKSHKVGFDEFLEWVDVFQRREKISKLING